MGDQVIAMGHALDLPGGPTVTVGYVSALERAIPLSETITMEHLIQTDAAINPGNSGGPLVNEDGELVGINTVKIQGGEGIGFAIAIDPAMPLIEELIAVGKIERGYLGIGPVNVTEALAMNFDLPVTSGVGIASVAPGSPAEMAGLQPQDIIVAIGGEEVATIADLDKVLIEYRKDSPVDVELFRGERRLTLTVVLGERPTE